MKYVCIALLLLSVAAQAQLKIPGRKELEKKAEKAVEKATKGESGQAKSGKSESASGDSQVAIPPEETNSPAKAYINSFWKNIEKMKNHDGGNNKQVVYKNGINACGQAINNTKMKDKSYNTAEMEKALAIYQAEYDNMASGHEADRGQKSKTQNDLNYLFDRNTKNLAYYNHTMGKTDAETLALVRANDDSIARYKTLAHAFMQQPKDDFMYNEEKKELLQVARSYQAPNAAGDTWPRGLDGPMTLLAEAKTYNMGTFSLAQEIKYEEAYWYAAKVIYPGTPEFEKAYEWSKKALDKIGTTDDFLKVIGKSQSDYAKSIKMPAPKLKDPALEERFKTHFNELYKGNASIVKVSIQSSDWVVERNEWTGVVTGRSRMAVVGAKDKAGKCFVCEFWLTQDYNGSGYGQYRTATASPLTNVIACENLQ